MKKINFNITVLAGIVLMMFLPSACSDILDEEPRSIYEPSFFQTERGVVGGVTALHAHLRYIFGQGYYYNSTLTGTDEYTYAQSADGNFLDADLSGAGSLTSSTSRSDVLWNEAFMAINTANGIIENAAEAGVGEDLVSEARFFRAFDYFLLVQTFGGVPLDLGSGELKFNTTPSRTSVRNTVPEVYTKAIFPDLLIAIENLPDAGRVTGGVTKTLARLYLAKAYLTYAWWLENPNSIPTYPEAPRTDPDGHDAAWYFQQAYDVATTAIANPGPFGLQPTFYDVNLAENDRNNEILLYADHTETSEFYNGASLTYGSDDAPDNFAVWMVTWNYNLIRSQNASGGDEASVQRIALQPYGRPWTRMAPPIDIFTNTFADKTNDSRYDGTFVTVFRGNWDKKGNIPADATLYNANNLPIKVGDPILTFLPDNSLEDQITYVPGNVNGYGDIGAGVIEGRADFVVLPTAISRFKYPNLWKLGGYRTNDVPADNAASTRPFNIAKFSELYLIAAEAAVKGATGSQSARDLVNVLRVRAGNWRFSNAENVEKIENNSEAMTAATPATITIDYILAERSREYFGEGYRWFDLVRTQTWERIAGTYRICGSNRYDRTPQTVTRSIEKYHYLRPIPRPNLEKLEMTAEEKRAYQNPGYVEDFTD